MASQCIPDNTVVSHDFVPLISNLCIIDFLIEKNSDLIISVDIKNKPILED